MAIDAEDRVLLVRQWRTPASRVLLEIPAGTLDVDESTGVTEDPDRAARRELEEETGYRAGTWRKLAVFWTAPGFASELMHLYLATDLEPAHPDERLGPDEDEHLRLERRPFAQAVKAVEAGEIADAKSIAGLLSVDRMRREGPGLNPAQPLTVPMRTYRATVIEYAMASATVIRRSRASLVFATLFAAAAAWAILSAETVLAIVWIVLAIAFATGLFAFPFALLAAWRYRDRILQETAVGVGPSGFVYRTDTYVGETGWGTFRRIRETGQFLFLDLGPQQLYVPLRVFTREELVEIRRLSAGAGFGPDGRRRSTRGPRGLSPHP